MARPYTLFKRPTTKQKAFMYYVQFRDEEGKRMFEILNDDVIRVNGFMARSTLNLYGVK